ncbi:hypothetical protein PG997_008907 [Apiospora hydei]|uniref:Zn(2)-C6 fungal-type domain-containing protein n=1 Tax=Apiospora hydei TaxID=1337664 RepID=A0ABR1WC53_9PEZI
MVGIPKSNRCSFCKARKTKCDEAWPTCGTCQRAKRPCSGPPRMKFVINGCHSTSGGYDSASSTSERSDASTPRDDHNQTSPPRILKQHQPKFRCRGRNINEDRGSLHRLRLPNMPPKPRDITPTPADQLAAELIWCLNAAPGTGHDLYLWGASLGLLPPLLGQSAALQHATKLLTTTWSNIQRGYPRRAWLDAQLYDACLISLQQTLEQVFEDPTSKLTTTATLAAQTLLQKVEVNEPHCFCNDASVTHQSNHAAGLSAVISMGGCDQGFSELGLHLVFESFFTVLMGDVRCVRDSVFAEPAWSSAMHKALDAATSLKPKLLSRFYRFWLEVAVWPTLVRQLRQLHEKPTESMLAAEVILRASALLEYLEDLDKAIFAKAIELGSIVEVENNTNRTGRDDEKFTPTSYEFANYNLANFFRAHAFFTIIALRILQCANTFLTPLSPYGGYTECGEEDQSCHSHSPKQQQQQQLQSKILDFSRRLWQVYPYMRRRRPLELGGTLHLVVAYEAGDARQKALTCAALREVESGHDGSFPPPDEDATIVAEAMALTGRSLATNQDNELIDWDAELQDLGSMDLSSELFLWDLQGLGTDLGVEPALA